MWLVVGLGNPGPTYARHRHNIGAMVVVELARRSGDRPSLPKGIPAEVVTTRVGPSGMGGVGAQTVPVALMRTRTYMNESGIPTGGLAKFHKIPPAQVIAVHDELDLDLGRIRLKSGGGDNGHNGLKSIRAHLGTGDFHRVRLGIGRPPGQQRPADYVLSNFSKGEQPELEVVIARAADAVESLILNGLSATQNAFNS